MKRPQTHVYRSIWEKANGKKFPVGYHVHHIDGNPHNNDPSNLQAVTPEEHYAIHKAQGDTWAAASLKGLMNVKPDYREFKSYSDKILWEMSCHGLIRIPPGARQQGIKAPEITFFSELDEEIENFINNQYTY